jgi:hypothetical protein
MVDAIENTKSISAATLNLSNGSQFAIDANDAFTNVNAVGNGTVLTVEADKITNSLSISGNATANSLVDLDLASLTVGFGGTLDLKGNDLTTTGTLSVGIKDFGSGSIVNPGAITAPTLNVIQGSKFTIDANDAFTDVNAVGNGTVLTIEADKITNSLSISGNAAANSLVDLDLASLTVGFGGTLDLKGNDLTTTGTLSVGIKDFGSGSIVNPGAITAPTLNVIQGSKFTIDANDAFTNVNAVGNGTVLTIEADKITNSLSISGNATANSLVDLDLASLTVGFGGTLDLKGNDLTTTGTLSVGIKDFGSGSIVNPGAITAPTLNVIQGSKFTIDANDAFTDVNAVGNGTVLTIEADKITNSLSISGNAAANSLVDLDLASLTVGFGGTLDLKGNDLTTTGTLSVGIKDFGSGTILNPGVVSVTNLNILQDSVFQLNGDDTVTNTISIGDTNDLLQVIQASGDLTGLTFNGNSLNASVRVLKWNCPLTPHLLRVLTGHSAGRTKQVVIGLQPFKTSSVQAKLNFWEIPVLPLVFLSLMAQTATLTLDTWATPRPASSPTPSALAKVAASSSAATTSMPLTQKTPLLN